MKGNSSFMVRQKISIENLESHYTPVVTDAVYYYD